MDETNKLYDEKFRELVAEVASHDFETEDATTAVKNLEIFSKCRPPMPEPEPALPAVPETAWERFKCGAARVWDNETTRTVIKASGAFAGVATVTWATIHKDHVIERTALSQANQRSV